MNDDNEAGTWHGWRGRLATAWLAASFLIMAFGAAAQEGPADPPGRAARVSDVVGQVWLYNPDGNEWQTAQRNQPLTSGDRIATDEGGRAELSLGSTVLRLEAGTELQIVRLDDSRYVVRLQGGSVAARFRTSQAAAEFELSTDEGRFLVQAAGRYRFDRYEQASDVTVLTGRAVFEGRGSALPVGPGQHAQFWLDAGGVAQYSMVPPVRDDFAAWNDDRDRADDRAPPLRYVSSEMTGAEDLDRYGRWEETPEYGALWYPAQTPADWAPYRAGRWAWVRPWGWTWVDEAPWGFAPFHYGRWVRHRESWAWAPGTRVARPVYAPALVAWMGGGGRGSVSVSIGPGGPPVGWFPLAPREVYVPGYRASSRYVYNVNASHVSNAGQINAIVANRNGEGDRRDFRNRGYAGAVTVVPANAFAGRQPVGPIAARFRNDPQARNLLSDGRPGPAQFAPPVAAPPVAPRPADARLPRPPFEGRAPGGFAGRPGSFGAGDSGRPGGQGGPRTDRPGMDRPGSDRPGAQRPNIDRPGADRPGADRPNADRPSMDRPGMNGAPALSPRPGQPLDGSPGRPIGRPEQAPDRPVRGLPAPAPAAQPAQPQPAQPALAQPAPQSPRNPQPQLEPSAPPSGFGRDPRAPRPGAEPPAEAPRFQGRGEFGRDPQSRPGRPQVTAPAPAPAPAPIGQPPAPAVQPQQAAPVDRQRDRFIPRPVEPARSADQGRPPAAAEPRAPRPEAPRMEAPRPVAAPAPAPRVEPARSPPPTPGAEAPRPQAAPRAESPRPEGRSENRSPRDDRKDAERVR